jgi:hypothetical protein
LADREEIAQLLIVLAGQFFATNFYNRWAARQALESAVFGLKAKVPGSEKFSTYVTKGDAAQGLVPAMLRWPGMNTPGDCAEDFKPLRLAQCLPDKIYHAFGAADPEKVKSAKFEGAKPKLSPGRKAAFERASNDLVRTSRDLIDVVLTDVDGIMGPYLKGIAVKRNDVDGRSVVPFRSDVEKLVVNKPEVFAAAAANLQAMNALWDFDANDPERRNILRMMEINRALHSYAASHGDKYPQSLDVLFEQGYLKPPVEPVSVLSGKHYIYVAAGAKVPEKAKDKSHFVVLYDSTPDQWGLHQCTYASWIAGAVPVKDIKEQIKAR